MTGIKIIISEEIVTTDVIHDISILRTKSCLCKNVYIRIGIIKMATLKPGNWKPEAGNRKPESGIQNPESRIRNLKSGSGIQKPNPKIKQNKDPQIQKKLSCIFFVRKCKKVNKNGFKAQLFYFNSIFVRKQCRSEKLQWGVANYVFILIPLFLVRAMHTRT